MATTDQTEADDSAVRRLLAVLGLCGLAIAQPVLDVFGNSPTTFRSHNIEGAGIVTFAVGVAVVPPMLLWIAGEIATLIRSRLGRWLHLATIGSLLFLFTVLLAKEFTHSTAVQLILAALATGATSFLYARRAEFRTWTRILSVVNILLLAQFLLLSPTTDWVDPGTQVALEPVEGVEASVTPIVMVVLDELPTQSIIDGESRIDAVRFPNLAQFADDATWYRHFSTVSPFTPTAVPVLLDGRDPTGEPIWTDHPESLFSLFATSHDFIVSESLTALCGFPNCRAGLTPQVPTGDEITSEPEPPGDVSPLDRLRWGDLIDLTLRTWGEQVRPGRTVPSEAFDDFQEDIPLVNPAVSATTPPTSTTAPSQPIATSVPPLTDEEADFARFLAVNLDSQPARVRQFIDALPSGDDPFFAFLHIVLPHQPWLIREDGTRYDAAEGRRDFDDRDDAWPVRVSRQRHLLQAEYTDQILGSILTKLQAVDRYDEALIVVVSDHGVGFQPDQSNRRISDENLEQIAYSPLLIKAPGQTSGEINDANVLSVDLAPTIAALAGSATVWDTAGAPIGSAAFLERGSEKYIYEFDATFQYEFLGVRTFDDSTTFPNLSLDLFGPITDVEPSIAGLYRGVPGNDLIGRSADGVFDTAPSEEAEVATVDQLSRLTSPEADGPPLGEVAGTVASASGSETVLVAVNGVVVGVSPLYVRDGTPNRFVVLLPTELSMNDGVEVRLAQRNPDGSVRELRIVES